MNALLLKPKPKDLILRNEPQMAVLGAGPARAAVAVRRLGEACADQPRRSASTAIAWTTFIARGSDTRETSWRSLWSRNCRAAAW